MSPDPFQIADDVPDFQKWLPLFGVGEEWRPIAGTGGRYDVSNRGRVRSWLRAGNGAAAGRLRESPLLLRPGIGSSGYLGVSLTTGHRPVHVLVLEAFSGPRPAGMEARHLDCRRLHNDRGNLAWGTPAENRADSIRLGTFRRPPGRTDLATAPRDAAGRLLPYPGPRFRSGAYWSRRATRADRTA